MPPEEVSSLRIDRLFKLFDQYKRGFVNFGDFLKILLKDSYTTPEKRISSRSSLTSASKLVVSLEKTSDFFWCKKAKQQLSIIIYKNYASLNECFAGKKIKLKINYF